MNTKVVVFAIFTFVALFLSYFYWTEVRPARIKHDCSWVRRYDPGKQAIPPMNKEELMEKGIINKCPLTGGDLLKFSGLSNSNISINTANNPLLIPRSCEEANQKIIEEYKKGKPAIPSQEWWEPATNDEYRFCLHDRGI